MNTTTDKNIDLDTDFVTLKLSGYQYVLLKDMMERMIELDEETYKSMDDNTSECEEQECLLNEEIGLLSVVQEDAVKINVEFSTDLDGTTCVVAHRITWPDGFGSCYYTSEELAREAMKKERNDGVQGEIDTFLVYGNLNYLNT